MGTAPADLPGFDQYANVRPTRILPGIQSPLRHAEAGSLDWAIVRENSEGEYSGNGGRTHRGLPEEVGTEVAILLVPALPALCAMPSSWRRAARASC